MTNKLITIKDVAKKAGVSFSTVSRVINNADNVSEILKSRVNNAITELRFKPNQAARLLVRKKTNSIGIIVTNLHDPFFSDLIYGFEIGAQNTKYNLMFCSTLCGDNGERDKYIKFLTNGLVDGVILYGSYLSDKSIIQYLHESNPVDYIVIENDISEINCNKLLIDNAGGAMKAITYLYEHGHRKIAHIAGNPNRKVSLERYTGYLNSMHAYDLNITESYIQYVHGDSDTYQKMENLLNLPDRPTAVFCFDDNVACMAIQAVLDHGLAVPEDISIIGFDNRRFFNTPYSGPAITSIGQPLFEIGKESIELLSNLIDEKIQKDSICKVFDTTLIEKETVCFLNNETVRTG
jgi:LacI family transcriptional regulator